MSLGLGVDKFQHDAFPVDKDCYQDTAQEIFQCEPQHHVLPEQCVQAQGVFVGKNRQKISNDQQVIVVLDIQIVIYD
jgi:hypothetical protein